jgi:hypothetical protein
MGGVFASCHLRRDFYWSHTHPHARSRHTRAAKTKKSLVRLSTAGMTMSHKVPRGGRDAPQIRLSPWTVLYGLPSRSAHAHRCATSHLSPMPHSTGTDTRVELQTTIRRHGQRRTPAWHTAHWGARRPTGAEPTRCMIAFRKRHTNQRRASHSKYAAGSPAANRLPQIPSEPHMPAHLMPRATLISPALPKWAPHEFLMIQ